MVPLVEFIEAWIFESDDPDDRPFSFVKDLYTERSRRKALGLGSEKALKLALNSLYGKFAQQLGWSHERPERIPPYHDLLIAGYITSHCRAAVLRAALRAPEDVIAFETDALFSTRPLPLDLGAGLGQWEEIRFEWLAYAQSGVYWGDRAGGVPVAKSRGIDKDSLDIDSFERAMRGCDCSDCTAKPPNQRHVMHGTDTRFINLGLAFMGDWKRWNQWVRSPRVLALSPEGKRTHSEPCPACYHEFPAAWSLGCWHPTECMYPHRFTAPVMNAPHPVMWDDWDGSTDLDAERVEAIMARQEHDERRVAANSWGDCE
jgi:hypothetical protein